MLKRFLPRSLFGRAVFIVVTPVVLLQIVAAVVFYDRHLDAVTRRASSDTRSPSYPSRATATTDHRPVPRPYANAAAPT